MRILYHAPSLESIYAQRTIYHGFKNAFIDLGHEFRPLTADDNLAEVLETYRPDLFVTASHYYYRMYLDFEVLRRYRNEGLFVLVKIDFWDSPIASMRIHEAKSLKDDKKFLDLISRDLFGDAYFHVVDQQDQRMAGFTQVTGRRFYTIPLAADKALVDVGRDERFVADVSYVGSSLPDKRKFFSNYVYPLGLKNSLKIYGQDWTAADRALGWVQRAGQFLNIKPMAKIRKPKLELADEGRIYASSLVSINVHEEYQRTFGGDCNERTFKIPLCGGFEVVDSVSCIRKYFEGGKEIIIADSPKDWVEKVHHYLKYPEQRLPIIEAGRQRVLRDHTYHSRASEMIAIRNAGGK